MGSYARDFYSPKATQRPTVGDTKFSVVGQDHMGWLKCDGRGLSTTDYNFLFQVIGYKFGGSGSTFNLPDAEGRVPGAVGVSTNATRRLGDLSGEEEHTLTIGEMPAHKHGSADVTGNTNGDGFTDLSGNHRHTYLGVQGQDAGTMGGQTSVAENDPRPTENTGYAGIHAHRIGSTGGGAAHNNMQPTIFIGNIFIFGGKVRPSATNYYPYATGLFPPVL